MAEVCGKRSGYSCAFVSFAEGAVARKAMGKVNGKDRMV